MELPQEIEVRYTIPAVRRALAQALRARGLAQRDIAKRLEVTEAAVSQYLANKRGTPVSYPIPLQAAIEAAADRVATDASVARAELQRLIARMKDERVICQIHKQRADVDEDCSSCYD